MVALMVGLLASMTIGGFLVVLGYCVEPWLVLMIMFFATAVSFVIKRNYTRYQSQWPVLESTEDICRE